MSSQELHSDGAEQGDRRERMTVSAVGSEPSFQNLRRELYPKREEWETSKARKRGQLKSKLRQLGREEKKRKADKKMEDSTYGCLELRFTGPLPDIIYTMDKVKAENTKDLFVELIDARTGDIVASGPESSMKVQLDILRGEFKGAETGNFSLKYFEENIIPRIKDNGQLVFRGENILNLNEGIAEVGDFKIAANSRCTLSGRFRLAARVTDGGFKGMRVKEAITNAFVVKVHRVKSARKPPVPRLKDGIERLKGIRKGGPIYQRLTNVGIKTVEDFLKSLNESEEGLRNIAGMRTDLWEDAVKHAKRCTLTSERILRPISNQQLNDVYDVAQPKKIAEMATSEAWEAAVKHAKTCVLSENNESITRPISSRQVNPVYDVAPPKKVLKRPPLQDWPGQHEAVGSSGNAPINFSSQAFAASSYIGGINEGFASTFGDASENFGLDAMFSPQVPATHVNPLYGQFQEKNSLELGFEDTERCVGSFDFDHDPTPSQQRKEGLCNMTMNSIDTQGRVNVSAAASFPNISAESTHKDERAPKNFR